ncbi:spore germination protein [Fodinisporobacter ferrooxydans]|uniref:Spore germination protein n=1 Tax=Fodinisporobacter ferrooxydans TaxID=2901836 RepID=A0ABY4CHV1_9BACL|nr:spore germination protein [Alicyclobacillaceae bacterium MYW30-H2]
MLEKGKIGLRQFIVFVILFTIGSSILVAPSGLAQEGKQDGWMAEILALALGLLLVWLYNTLGKRFPNLTLAEYCQEILGKWPGRAVALLFLSYYFVLASLLLREIGDFLTTQIMPETPIQAVHVIFLIIVIMGARLGLEPLVRAGEIFLPWVIFLFLVMVVFISPQIKFDNMQPLLGEGFKPVLRAAFPALGLPYMELCVFLMIFPYINRPEKIGKAFGIGTIIAGVMLIIVVLLSILVIGADLTALQIYPSYVIVKKISIGHFLERIEAVMAGIWFLTIYFKLTLCFYAVALGLAQILKLKDYRCLTFPLGMIAMAFSIVGSPNIIYFNTFVAKIWTPYSLTFGLVLPLVLLAVNTWNRKRAKKMNQ